MKTFAAHKISLITVAVFCLFSAGLYHQPAEARGGDSRFFHHFRSSLVSGTVVLNGCQISPRRLHVLAVPLTASIDGLELPAARKAKSRRAHLRRTRDPHVFRFFIAGLDRSKNYQINIGAPPNPCGKVFWRGPFAGIVSAGTRDVRIEGFAATSELEVFDPIADEWLGAATFSLSDVANGSAVKNFRWRSKIAGAESGEVQIATSAFPREGDFGACDEPDSGIVMRAQVPLDPDGWTDLGSFDFSSLFGRTFPLPDGEFPTLMQAETIVDGETSSVDDTLTPISKRDQMLISLGAPLYLRVVAKTADGPACNLRTDGVAGWAMVASDVGLQQVEVPPTPPPPGPLQAGNGHFYGPPFIAMYPNGTLLPGYREQAFAVTKPHKLPQSYCFDFIGLVNPLRQIDPLGCALLDIGFAENNPGLVPNATVQPGLRFLLGPPSSSGGGGLNPLTVVTNTVGNFTTGIYNAVSYGVDAAAKLFDEIKKSVAKLALAALSIEPFKGACDALQNSGPLTCDELVKTGIDVGLASMGLPPSLPNFEDLKQQGINYVANQIASQTGIPPEVAAQALTIAKDAIEELAAKSGGSDPKYNWVTPYFGVDPAYVELVVQKNTFSQLPDGLILLRGTTNLFEGGAHAIPSGFISIGDQRIPMLLRPNAVGIANPICNLGPFNITCTPNFFATKPICRVGRFVSGGQIEYTDYDCNTLGSTAPQVYFRDEWYRQRYQNAFCTTISAISKQDSGLGPVPPPLGYSFGIFAGLLPQQPRSWNGAFYFECFNS